jgi:tetratricopeptide (TPR) repeat protein
MIEAVILLVLGIVAVVILTHNNEPQPIELQGTCEEYITDANKSLNERQYRFAEKSFKLALIKAKQVNADKRVFARIIGGLGATFLAQSRYAESEAMLREALEMNRIEYGANDLRVSTILSQLAALFAKQCRYFDAEDYYQQSLTIQEEQLVPDHPDVLKTALSLASLYFQQEKYDEAEPLYHRALAKYLQALKPITADLMTEFQNLVTIYKLTDRQREARELEDRLEKIQPFTACTK